MILNHNKISCIKLVHLLYLIVFTFFNPLSHTAFTFFPTITFIFPILPTISSRQNISKTSMLSFVYSFLPLFTSPFPSLSLSYILNYSDLSKFVSSYPTYGRRYNWCSRVLATCLNRVWLLHLFPHIWQGLWLFEVHPKKVLNQFFRLCTLRKIIT